MIEIVTRLGDTIVDIEIRADARGLPHPVPYRITCGLGWVEAREVPRTRMPRRRLDRRVLAYVTAAALVHGGILIAALRARSEPPPVAERGARRPRLVANHATQVRAAKADTVVPSPEQVETIYRQGASQSREGATRPVGRAREARTQGLDGASASSGALAVDHAPSARHFDPCTDGDCGLIETGAYDTRVDRTHAGASYELAPRKPRELALSVVTCTVDGGCNTVSGTDQGDIRTALAPHVGELRDCFALDHAAGPTAAIDLRVEGGHVVEVAAHERGAVGSCIERVVRRLDKLTTADREVTLAFARD